MEYLPLYLGGFGIVILSLVGWAWLQNELLKKRLIARTVETLNTGATAEQVQKQFHEENTSPADAKKLLELAQICLHRHQVMELLEEGQTEEAVIASLTAQGISNEVAQETVAGAQFSRFCQKRPVLSLTLGICLPILGLALIVAGVLLFYGNYSGLFVTFRYAERITLGVGLVTLWGGWKVLMMKLRS